MMFAQDAWRATNRWLSRGERRVYARAAALGFAVLLTLFLIGRRWFAVPFEFLLWAAAWGGGCGALASLAVFFESGWALVTVGALGVGHEVTRDWFYPRPPHAVQFFKENGLAMSAQWFFVALLCFALAFGFLHLILAPARKRRDRAARAGRSQRRAWHQRRR
jgi:hypothetical protein